MLKSYIVEKIMNTFSLHLTESIFCQKKTNSSINLLLWLFFGVVTLAFASQISIPFHPVPLTFQSTTVILIGMIFGSRHATYIVCTYLFAGMCGLPVFADFSGGIQVLFGPTSGYLFGFLPAAFLSGYLTQKGCLDHILTGFIAACFCDSIIFALGVTILALFIGWKSAIIFGFTPFVISEIIKLLAVSYLVTRFWKKSL
jgi:biotin transport system substrate-specific component